MPIRPQVGSRTVGFSSEYRGVRTPLAFGQWDWTDPLTKSALPDIMSDMKQVNAREFQKDFSTITGGLKQGQTIAVTRRGKPLGFFTKARKLTGVTMPDFAANLQDMPYSAEEGERIVREVLDDTLS
jgi:hypothetical protein